MLKTSPKGAFNGLPANDFIENLKSAEEARDMNPYIDYIVHSVRNVAELPKKMDETCLDEEQMLQFSKGIGHMVKGIEVRKKMLSNMQNVDLVKNAEQQKALEELGYFLTGLLLSGRNDCKKCLNKSCQIRLAETMEGLHDLGSEQITELEFGWPSNSNNFDA